MLVRLIKKLRLLLESAQFRSHLGRLFQRGRAKLMVLVQKQVNISMNFWRREKSARYRKNFQKHLNFFTGKNIQCINYAETSARIKLHSNQVAGEVADSGVKMLNFLSSII